MAAAVGSVPSAEYHAPRPRVRTNPRAPTNNSTPRSTPEFDATLYIPLVRADVTDKMIFNTLRKMNVGFIGRINLVNGGYVRGGHSFSRAFIPIRWNTSTEGNDFRSQLSSQPHVRVFYSQSPPLFWKVSLSRVSSPESTPVRTTQSRPTTTRHSQERRAVPPSASRRPHQIHSSTLHHQLNAALARIMALEQRLNESGLTLSAKENKVVSAVSEQNGGAHSDSKSEDEFSVDDRESIEETSTTA